MTEQNSVIIGALEKCTSRASIEDVFSKFQVVECTDKTERLNETMGSPQTFFSAGELSAEDKYEITIQMFLSMSWKLAKLYDRLGVGL